MIKDFVGGDSGCALLTFSDKSLHFFPQPRELFPVYPGRARPACRPKPATGSKPNWPVEFNLQRRAGQHPRRVGQELVEPVGHAARLALALGAQRTLEIGGRKSHLPMTDKSSAMTVQHVTNAGTKG